MADLCIPAVAVPYLSQSEKNEELFNIFMKLKKYPINSNEIPLNLPLNTVN